MLQQSLDIFRLIKLIDKLHAAVSVLIDIHPESLGIMDKVRSLNSFAKTIWLGIQKKEYFDLLDEHKDAF